MDPVWLMFFVFVTMALVPFNFGSTWFDNDRSYKTHNIVTLVTFSLTLLAAGSQYFIVSFYHTTVTLGWYLAISLTYIVYVILVRYIYVIVANSVMQAEFNKSQDETSDTSIASMKSWSYGVVYMLCLLMMGLALGGGIAYLVLFWFQFTAAMKTFFIIDLVVYAIGFFVFGYLAYNISNISNNIKVAKKKMYGRYGLK